MRSSCFLFIMKWKHYSLTKTASSPFIFLSFHHFFYFTSIELLPFLVLSFSLFSVFAVAKQQYRIRYGFFFSYGIHFRFDSLFFVLQRNCWRRRDVNFVVLCSRWNRFFKMIKIWCTVLLRLADSIHWFALAAQPIKIIKITFCVHLAKWVLVDRNEPKIFRWIIQFVCWFQVMLYVDGMNGVMRHGPTIQWLYSLIASKYRLVVKTALKLLLVFVEYVESNCYLLVNAIHAVDSAQNMLPWSNIMKWVWFQLINFVFVQIHFLVSIFFLMNHSCDRIRWIPFLVLFQNSIFSPSLKQIVKNILILFLAIFSLFQFLFCDLFRRLQSHFG